METSGEVLTEIQFIPLFRWGNTEAQKDEKTLLRFYYQYLIVVGFELSLCTPKNATLSIVSHCHARLTQRKVPF